MEAQFVMFYEGLTLWRGSHPNDAVMRRGSPEEAAHVRGGSELGSYEDLMNVSRVLSPGGSFCSVLQGSEALGGRPSNGPVKPSGSAKEGPHVRGGI